MRRTRIVYNLDTGEKYIFANKTPLEAMNAMIYTLNIREKCNAVVNKTESGKVLYFVHKGCTYSTVNEK